jgi:peptidylprolyl isomerase/peptidyl-prolyl cis-trans isomerase D
LDDLLYFAEDVNDFEGEAAKAGLSLRNMIVQSDQPQLPDGIGYSRALMNFLASAEEGAFSEVIELNQDFIAVQLMERTPEGHAAFEEVQAQIRPLVVTQKKRAIISGRLASAIATGDFNTLAERVGTIERTAQQIAANTTNVPGVGREPAFVGAALGTAEGAISGVVEGQAAAFVLLIERRNEAPAMTDASKNAIAQSIRAERIQTLSQEWLESLKAEADIEDNRLRFEVQ